MKTPTARQPLSTTHCPICITTRVILIMGQYSMQVSSDWRFTATAVLQFRIIIIIIHTFLSGHKVVTSEAVVDNHQVTDWCSV